MLKRYRFIVIVLAHLLMGCAVAAAQDEAGGGTEPGRSEAVEAVPAAPPRRAALGEIYLEEAGGVLRPVPGVTIEQFLQIYDKAQGLNNDSQMSNYSIQSLTAVGRAGANRVDLSVTLSIFVEGENWIRIPLFFRQAALRSLPSDADSDRQRVRVDDTVAEEATDGAGRDYVLWLRGRGGESTEEVHLEFSVPITGLGRERRLVLSVPGAAKSELTLTVPMANAVAEVSGGGILEDIVPNGEGATDLVVRGLRGDVDLVWRQTNGNAVQSAPVVTSTGAITATVDRHHVEFEAKLTVVRPYGRELRRFEVRLPPGAILSEGKYAGYTVSDVTPENQESQEGRLVEVNFTKPVIDAESTVVTLRASSDATAAMNGQFPLAGFEVAKAIWQKGIVTVRERGDWDVRCDVGRGCDRVSEVPPDLKPEEVIAVFRYFEQPFTLAARVFPKQTRISVEPRYYLSIEPRVARLDAPLKYAIRGNKAYELKIDLNGWEYDRIGPDQQVITEACEVDESGVLVVSLQDGMMGEFELSLQAHRPIDTEATSIALPLPTPHATSLSSTALIVLPADNIDLREDREKTTGLVRQNVAPPLSVKLPEIQQEPLYYRGETGETGEAVFAAELSVRPQEVTAELSTEISITATEASVRERLIYDVKYEPAKTLSIRMPQELAELGVVEYSLDGEAVAAVDTEQTAGEDTLVRRIVLPSPRQGRFELTAEYPVSGPKLQPLSTALCVVPLVVPEDVVLTGHRVRATVREGIGIGVREGRWQQMGNDLAGYGNTTVNEFAAETPEVRIVFLVHQKDPDTLGSAVVEAAWIQTWMTERERRDRVAYRFVSDRRHLVVSLPSGANTDYLRVLMDGQETEYTLPSERTVRVVLSAKQTPRPHVLELWYHFSEARPARGSMQLELPQIANGVWVRRSYWQLVLPGSEHMISAPTDCTAEYEWGWRGIWWGRIPVKEQTALENWVGAVHDTPVPKATSRYLFSKFGPPRTVELRTASRTWIVGGASSLALLIGLLVIYAPATRHPLFGLVLVIAVASGAVMWPGAALLFAQAAGMGLVLSVLGAVLYRGVARRRRRTVRRDVSSSVFERGSTQAQFGSSEIELIRSPADASDAAAIHAPED